MATAVSRIEGDVFVNGNLTAKTQTLPANAVTNATVAGAAGIAAGKLQHQFKRSSTLCNHTTAAAVVRQGLYAVYGSTAQILSFKVWASVSATSTGVITVDLLKNGTSILTAPITLDSTITAFTSVEAAGFTSPALVAGDKLEVAILTAVSTVLPKGVNAEITLTEDAA